MDHGALIYPRRPVESDVVSRPAGASNLTTSVDPPICNVRSTRTTSFRLRRCPSRRFLEPWLLACIFVFPNGTPGKKYSQSHSLELPSGVGRLLISVEIRRGTAMPLGSIHRTRMSTPVARALAKGAARPKCPSPKKQWGRCCGKTHRTQCRIVRHPS